MTRADQLQERIEVGGPAQGPGQRLNSSQRLVRDRRLVAQETPESDHDRGLHHTQPALASFGR